MKTPVFSATVTVIAAFAATCLTATAAVPYPPQDGGLERMFFNNPGLEVDLGVGIWPHPAVYDYDGDGQLDLIVGSSCVPFNGTRLYLNPTPKGEKNALSVFPGGKDVPESARIHRDGKVHPKAPPDSVVPHPRPDKRGSWYTVDLDGDGLDDLVHAISDWSNYGAVGPKCAVAYDANGVWANSQLEAYLYYFHTVSGTGESVKFDRPVKILAEGSTKLFLEGPWGVSRVMFHDWDGDGDTDFICGEFVDSFWYFENTAGKGNAPKFAKGRKALFTDGTPMTVDLCMYDPRAVDWNGDGLMDIIAAEEDGRVSYYENTSKFKDGAPVFKLRRYFRQKAQELKFGCLSTPFGVDWDGDGDWDFICGNSAGYVAFIENLSGPGVAKPKWAEPKLMTVKGKPIRTMAGPNGSPQGPAEAKWGYSGVSVGDWDGDGVLDVIVNDINGDVRLYRGASPSSPKGSAAATKRGALDMNPGVGIEVEWEGGKQLVPPWEWRGDPGFKQPVPPWEWRGDPGKCLRAPWRTTVEMVDWNGDRLQDLVLIDYEGYLNFYERYRDEKGELRLKAPRRILCDTAGEPIRLAFGTGGGSGRRRFRVVDFDGDGKLDILVSGTNAIVYRQVGEKDGNCLFRWQAGICDDHLAGHTCAPTVVDFDANGIPDVVIAAEDGYFYYLENPRSWAKRLPKSRTFLKGEKSFDGKTRLGIENSGRIVPHLGDFTISLGVKADPADRDRVQSLFSAYCPTPRIGERGMPELVLSFDPKHLGKLMFRVDPVAVAYSKTDVADGNWHDVKVRRVGDKVTMEVDGKIEANVTCAEPFWSFNGWALGARPEKTGEKCKEDQFFLGSLRDVKVEMQLHPR